MTKYVKKEQTKYWPVSSELLAQYKDGSHTNFNGYGTLTWVQNNVIHRDGDKPAIIYSDGSLGWFQNGKIHRDGDLPAKIYSDGRLDWYQNGKLHRYGDKPAFIGANGWLAWYQNGQRHRFSGPATIDPDGRQEWWINSENITEEVRKWLNGEEWQGTPEQITEFKLRFT